MTDASNLLFYLFKRLGRWRSMAAEMPVWLVQQPASRLAGYFLLVDAMFVPLYFKLHAGIDSIWYEQINKAQKSTYSTVRNSKWKHWMRTYFLEYYIKQRFMLSNCNFPFATYQSSTLNGKLGIDQLWATETLPTDIDQLKFNSLI